MILFYFLYKLITCFILIEYRNTLFSIFSSTLCFGCKIKLKILQGCLGAVAELNCSKGSIYNVNFVNGTTNLDILCSEQKEWVFYRDGKMEVLKFLAGCSIGKIKTVTCAGKMCTRKTCLQYLSLSFGLF